MTITRNGNDYELTERELSYAYFEALNKFDIEDIIEKMENSIDNKEIYYEMIRDKKFASKVAYRYRKYLNDYDNGDRELDAIVDAYNYVKNSIMGSGEEAKRSGL